MDLVLTGTERKDKRFVERADLRLYKPHNASYLPVECSGALFRFGHSMVRDSYRLNDGLEPIPTFSSAASPAELEDLRGHRTLLDRLAGRREALRAPARRSADAVQADRQPSGAVPERPPEGRRPDSAGALPCSTSTSTAADSPSCPREGPSPLQSPRPERRWLGRRSSPALPGLASTPLWLWTLQEAEVTQGGVQLGPVAGRAVSEVITGLVARDPGSYLKAAPAWTPTLPSVTAGDFTLADLLGMPRPQRPRARRPVTVAGRRHCHDSTPPGRLTLTSQAPPCPRPPGGCVRSGPERR